MKILDNNALSYAQQHKILLKEPYVTTPDIQDEFEAGFDVPLPKQVQSCTKYASFDQGMYLQHYKRMLNAYGASSFYSMRGFGDISILALLLTLKDSCAGMLPTMIEDIVVVTSDKKLVAHIKREFADATCEFDTKVQVISEAVYFQ